MIAPLLKIVVFASIAATMVSAYAGPIRHRYPIPSRGLVGYWKGDGNALDSARHHDGVLEGGMNFTQGVSDQAFNAGPGKRVFIPDSPDFELSSFTMGAWVNFQQPGYYVFFRGDNRSGLDPFAIAGDLSGNISLQITSEAGVTESLSVPISYNEWHQVTGTFDARTHSLRFYIDGNLAASKTTAITPMLGLDPSQAPGLGIGNTQDFYDFPFTGGIDEVVLYSRALSAAEVRTLARIRALREGALPGSGGGARIHHSAPAPPAPVPTGGSGAVDGSSAGLEIQRIDSSVVLTWPQGQLLEASERNGPWTTNEAAMSPYTVSPTNPRTFFRVVVKP